MNDSLQTIENKKSKKDKIIFGGLFLLIVLIIIAVFTYVATMATPKKVFVSSIDKMFETINEKSKEDIKTVSGDLSFQTKVNAKENSEIFDIINNLNLQFNYAFDYENKKMNAGINSTFQNKDLIKAKLYTKEKDAYVYLDKIYDKYIQIPIANFTEAFNSQDLREDYKTILNEIKKALQNSLKNKYFTSEKTKISINGKEIDVTKNILNLNEENQKSLYKDITSYLNNDTFINSVANITKEDNASIKNALESDDFEVSDDYTISIYTKGMIKEFMGIEISDDSTTFSFIKEDKETFQYIINGDEKIEGTIKIQKSDNHFTIEVSIKNDDANITLYFDTSYKYNEKIEDIDTTNSVSYENITEKEQEEILNNLLELEGIQLLSETFENLITSSYNTSF